jgi:periplasmic protein TonB
VGDAAGSGREGARGAGGSAAGAEGAGPQGSGVATGTVAALSGGRPGATPPEYDAYVRALRQRIEERLAYPALAVRRGVQGTVELELELDAAGRLTAVVDVGREGSALLREAAMRAVRSAAPFPFPPGLAARALTIRLPIVFELQRR